jgi:hypothetical protein
MKVMITQTVLAFKLEQSHDLISAHSGLARLDEPTIGPRELEALDKSLPQPGNSAEFSNEEDRNFRIGSVILSDACFCLAERW